MTPPALISAQPYQIRCAEIWGGTVSRQDEVATPGVRAAIHSSASGGDKGGDLYYISVCAFDTLTRIAVADVRGHGLAASQLSEWLYGSLEARMNDADGARVLRDLNEIICIRGFSAITTAVIATLHRDKGLLYYCYAGHPPLMLARQGQTWHDLPAPAGSGPANLPLGIVPDARFIQEKVEVAQGDRLFLYTDGVSECPGPEGSLDPELFADKKMRDALDRYTPRPLPEAKNGIHKALLDHSGGQLIHDDCTFMFVEVLAPRPLWKRRILPGKRRLSRFGRSGAS
jgi:serine phosphatase RsbU (regulator of sigma subunit)